MRYAWLTVLMLAGCASPVAPDEAAPAIGFAQIASGLGSVVAMDYHEGVWFVAEQSGKILTAQCPVLGDEACHWAGGAYLDLSSRIATGGERGLLDLAWHGDHLFVHYSGASDGRTVLARFDLDKEAVLFETPQPFSNHNGGELAIHDGYLYLGLGDGGAAGDPDGRAQDDASPLGKILRWKIQGDGSLAPAGQGDSPIWAKGLRNPWRFSFDSRGDLWVADVGQNRFEEINRVTPRPGLNFGWDSFEGNDAFEGKHSRDGLVFPVHTYTHDEGCSVTGGYVYDGEFVPSLTGWYVFGDYCSGRIWGLKDGTARLLADTDFKVSSFARSPAGEIFVLDHRGAIYQFVSADKPYATLPPGSS